MKNEQIKKSTYSIKDKKLRLYPGKHVNTKLYSKIRSAGFGWDEKRKLFAGQATTEMENLCLELTGAIDLEEAFTVNTAGYSIWLKEMLDRYSFYTTCAHDAEIAHIRLREIREDPSRLIEGDKLKEE